MSTGPVTVTTIERWQSKVHATQSDGPWTAQPSDYAHVSVLIIRWHADIDEFADGHTEEARMHFTSLKSPPQLTQVLFAR
jgi:hypothetical protein